MALTALTAMPGAALAEDLALLIANRSYDVHRAVPGAARVADLAPGLRAAGYRVITLSDLSRADMRRRLPAIVSRAKQADRLLVVVAGQIVSSPRDSFLLLRDTPEVDAFTVGADGLSLGALMDAASLKREIGVVAVADGRRPAEIASGVTDGFAPQGLPSGLTVISGPPNPLLRFLQDEVLARGVRLEAALRRAPAELEVFADGPMGAMVPGAGSGGRVSAFEEVLWQLAVAEDSILGFQTYLNRFPGGRYAPLAEAALQRLTETPEDRARRAEIGLGLSVADRQQVQTDLLQLGYYSRAIDGVFGSGTRAGIRTWQRQNGFAATGYLTEDALAELRRQGAARAAALRPAAEAPRSGPAWTSIAALAPGFSDARGWANPLYARSLQTTALGDTLILTGRGRNGLVSFILDRAGRRWVPGPSIAGFSDAQGWGNPLYAESLQATALGRRLVLTARGPGGLVSFSLDRTRGGWTQGPSIPGFGDAQGWGDPLYAGSIRTTAVGRDLIVTARGPGGILSFILDRNAGRWVPGPSIPGFGDAMGWGNPLYAGSIRATAVGRDLVLTARGPGGMLSFILDRAANAWVPGPSIPGFADARGWGDPAYAASIRTTAMDGTLVLTARSSTGLVSFSLDRAAGRWVQGPGIPGFADARGWSDPLYASSLRTTAVGGTLVLTVRGPEGLLSFSLDRAAGRWVQGPGIPGFADARGWKDPAYAGTIQTVAVGGTLVLTARGPEGLLTFGIE